MIITTNIYLLRHGKVNGPPALYGQTDIDVTHNVNKKILAELNTFQKNSTNKITHVVSSPFNVAIEWPNNFLCIMIYTSI